MVGGFAAGRRLPRVLVLAHMFSACAAHDGPTTTEPPSLRAVPKPAPAPGESPTEGSAPVPRRTLSAVVEPAVLRELEASGFALSELVLARPATTTVELDALAGWKSIFDVLRSDLAEVKRAQPLAKVTSIDGFRLFDERFLRSPEMRFELTGVFNRLDRKAFYEGSCGEVRFVYRLRYDTRQGGAPMGSRLPMTVNVVFLVSPEPRSCSEVARTWQPRTELPRLELARWLTGEGPLGPRARAAWTLKSVETNLQTFRIQSSVNVSMAGHIEYALRVFHPLNAERTAFAPAPMENTPDVAMLKRDPSLRAELLSYLKQPAVLAAADRGTLLLPQRFLAKRAISFSPRGLARPGNRPFRSLFSASDFDGVALANYRSVTTGAALLRRLDGATCTGCHQSRTLAGFHHLGLDENGPRGFTLGSGMSPHLESDLARRDAYVATLADGGTPDEFRPLPERQGVGQGFGAPCGLGDAGFAEWTCDPGFTCQAQEDPEIGVCTRTTEIGAACEYGVLSPGEKPHRDRIRALTRHECAARQSCIKNFSGFPQGACGSLCDEVGPAGACADLLDVDGFQNCLRGRRPFDACAAEFVLEMGLRACDREHPCRQDYVCARTSAGRDACVPPYFVYQLRLDGYPLRR